MNKNAVKELKDYLDNSDIWVSCSDDKVDGRFRVSFKYISSEYGVYVKPLYIQ